MNVEQRGGSKPGNSNNDRILGQNVVNKPKDHKKHMKEHKEESKTGKCKCRNNEKHKWGK